jgi:TetR/AcrR family transcriptional regulator
MRRTERVGRGSAGATRRRAGRATPAGAVAPEATVKPRGRAADEPDSRQRLLDAAAEEFATHGFAGASVDRIAAAARINKAMLYYHFGSKARLYQDIVGDMFRAVSARVGAVAASDAPPEAKLDLFIETIASEAEARPHFPAIWFREVAEGGAHLDAGTLGDITGILKVLGGILQEGVRAKQFQPANTFVIHAGIVAPLLLFFASGPLRDRLQAAGIRGATQVTRAEVVEHIKRVTRAIVQGKVQ